LSDGDAGTLVARLASGLWLAAIAAALAVGAVGSTTAQRGLVEGGPACPWRTITGLPCPMCGMTHATVALGGGDLGGALASHPAAPLVLALAIAPAALVLLGKTSWLTEGRRPWLWLGAIGVAWIARLAALVI